MKIYKYINKFGLMRMMFSLSISSLLFKLTCDQLFVFPCWDLLCFNANVFSKKVCTKIALTIYNHRNQHPNNANDLLPKKKKKFLAQIKLISSSTSCVPPTTVFCSERRRKYTKKTTII